MSDVLLSLRGLTKAYPGVVANNDVSFDIRPGEVHALWARTGRGNPRWSRRSTGSYGLTPGR
jgi:general nucleoside transport system ATP-binding protein